MPFVQWYFLRVVDSKQHASRMPCLGPCFATIGNSIEFPRTLGLYKDCNLGRTYASTKCKNAHGDEKNVNVDGAGEYESGKEGIKQ